MLSIKQVVSSLVLVSHPPSAVSAQQIQLQHLNHDLNTAGHKLTIMGLESPLHDPEHLQLLRLFAALVTALVTKVDAVQSFVESATHGGSGSHANSGMAGKSNSTECVYMLLMCLLFTSCQSFHTWPRTCRPARSLCEYASVRETIHQLIALIHHLARSRGKPCSMAASLGPQGGASNAHTILFVPSTYIYSIPEWPLSRVIREVEAFPQKFISLLCCVALEQLEEFPAETGRAQAAAVRAHPTVASIDFTSVMQHAFSDSAAIAT